MEKMTINKQFEGVRTFLIDNGAPAEMVAFIDNRMEQTKRKNSSRSNKPTKAQVENAQLAEIVKNAMATNDAYTVSEIQALVPEVRTLSNQRVTSVLGFMKDAGIVRREVVKGRAYFSLV